MICTKRRNLRGFASRCAGVAAIGLLAMLVVLPACRRPTATFSLPAGPSCPERLERIGQALHAYHDQFGAFPPAYVADEAGRPMYSWRVLLLPYLGHEALYSEFALDEPWDSPANRPLADTQVEAYRCPADPRGVSQPSPTTTSYLAVGGPGTSWRGAEPVSLDDVTDPADATILVAEVAASGVHWSEPRDLNLIQMAPRLNADAGQGISSGHAGQANVLMADGSVVALPNGAPANSLRAMLSIAGGEDVDPRKW